MYDASYHDPGKGYMKPAVYKNFGDYLETIAQGLTLLRFHYFQTRKKLYLFSPDQGRMLYHLPFTNRAHVDVLNPDMENYPAYSLAKGMVAELEHGETLFIPQLWWHYVHYVESGFSLALRANDKLQTKVRGVWNILRLFTIDSGMNYLAGHKWKQFKEVYARKKAAKIMVEQENPA